MERPRDISGFRSRAINAGYAWTDANRPIAGEGVAVSDAAGGRVVSLAPGARLPRPRPWDAIADLMEGELGVRLYTAPVVGPDGAPLPYDPEAEGFSDLAELPAEPDADGPGGAPRLAIAPGDVADGWVLAEANADLTAWRLALDPARAGAEGAVPVADLRVEDGGLSAARALHSGAVVLTNASAHWGAAWPLVALDGDAGGEWSAADEEESETPRGVAVALICDHGDGEDGDGGATWWRTLTFDCRGNLVAVSDRHGDPAAREEEPEPEGGYDCGNPLNGPGKAPSASGGPSGSPYYGMDRNPLDGEPADNPLDETGPGGYTPDCNRKDE